MLTFIEVWMRTSIIERLQQAKNHWKRHYNSTKMFSYSKDIIHHPRPPPITENRNKRGNLRLKKVESEERQMMRSRPISQCTIYAQRPNFPRVCFILCSRPNCRRTLPQKKDHVYTVTIIKSFYLDLTLL